MDLPDRDDVYDDFVRDMNDPRYSAMSRNAIVKDIVREIRVLKLPFPLTRHYMREAEVQTAYSALIKYKANIVLKSHSELKGHPGKMWLPSKFRESEIQLVTREGDWWAIDVIVDYFTEYARIRAKKDYAPSMQESWDDDEVLTKAVYNALSNGPVTCKSLRYEIFFLGRELGLFRVTRAKSLVQTILSDCKDYSNLRWLDMSAGWGDRLLTACSLNMDYIGFDPNIELELGHGQMIQQFGQVGKQCVIYKPFEQCMSEVRRDAEVKGKYDISLISPPFYIIERYNGENQSVDTFPEFKDWLVNFLFKSLHMIWTNLNDEPGREGYLAIHIGNIRNCDIVGPMQLFIEDFLIGSNWEGIITFSGRGTKDTPGIVYVWKKRNPALINDRILWDPTVKRSLRDMFPTIYRSTLKMIDELQNSP